MEHVWDTRAYLPKTPWAISIFQYFSLLCLKNEYVQHLYVKTKRVKKSCYTVKVCLAHFGPCNNCFLYVHHWRSDQLIIDQSHTDGYYDGIYQLTITWVKSTGNDWHTGFIYNILLIYILKEREEVLKICFFFLF